MRELVIEYRRIFPRRGRKLYVRTIVAVLKHGFHYPSLRPS